MDAATDRWPTAATSAVADSAKPRRQSPRRSFSRARARRLRSVPAGHRSRSRRFVESEALEVAEHDRHAEGARQSVDLEVQGLGLLALDHRPIGTQAGTGG